MIIRLLPRVFTIIILSSVLVSASCFGESTASTEIHPTDNTTTPVYISLEEALSNGKPTLAEFGSTNCIQCKMMKIVLDELAAKYEGKLNIVIIGVYRHRDLASQHGIMSIPTQIFFDSSGNEVFRNIGVMYEEDIVAQLNKMGIN